MAIVAVVIYLFLSKQNPPLQSGDRAEPFPLPDGAPVNSNQEFVFISKGKLFLWNRDNQVEQVHSPYIQEMVDRMERRKQLHGWKNNTSLAMSFAGQPDDGAADQVDLQVVSAQFASDNKLLYFIKDTHVGGLFEYDRKEKTERRLLHQQNLSYENLAVNPDNNQVLCSQQQANGIANIAMISEDGTESRQLTEGDTIDTSPAWIPGENNKILYQSSGLARSEDGYVIAHGPASIKLLDLADNQVTTVIEDPNFDYLQPRVDNAGNLYFIKRPYESYSYSGTYVLIDFLLFPFRLLRAVFHYLNFFSLMYSRKPLTSASGPQVKADIKDLLIKGKRIDAEKALRKEGKVNGIPSLVPRSWQLVRRTQGGQDSILATNVASFDISGGDTILYTNGYAVFQLAPDNRAAVLLRDKLIADIIAS
ncbi:MAG: hypothetical protein PVH98_06390 [Gammaproteobacteria bacterium]|jgi:hypothetical protein